MWLHQSLLTLSACLLVITGTASAFVPNTTPTHGKTFTSSWKLKQSLIDQQEQDGVVTEPVKASSNTPMAAVTAFVTANLPVMMALAEADDYEYGKVDAPIGLAVGGGILAILTALLPVFLRGGEEAFEEIRERDEGTFGSGKDVLRKK